MLNIGNLMGLDFETYCELSLPEVGLARYVNHPTFMPTLASVDTARGSVTIEFPAEDPKRLAAFIQGWDLTAHNAGFERAVLRKMGINVPVLDSAVVAAVAGADRHLAGAAKQLLNMDKLDEDRSLLKLFAMKQEGQVAPEFDRDLIKKNPDKWQQYKEYCERDAQLSRHIVVDWMGDPDLFDKEMTYAAITLKMNEIGWPVDVDAVKEMRNRYQVNLDQIQHEFALNVDPGLNIHSHTQVKKWCADRGIRSSSFDKQNVERLIARLDKLVATKGPLSVEHTEVYHLLKVKQALGGSSLKKLDTILAVQHEGRVYDQYVHAGAAQSLRTSGRSVQMQNLPRLASQPRNMEDLFDADSEWTNDELAENLRQVFRSSHPQGRLLVADFASIESRALGFLAGEDWKVQAYRQGQDIYKAQAMKIFRLNDISQVSKEQRTTGKVGELSCGYGAGPVAVKDFAAKMHVELTEGEAGKLVRDWREANPRTVEFWDLLGEAMFQVVETGRAYGFVSKSGLGVRFIPTVTPVSLNSQAPDAQSIQMVVSKGTDLLMSRVFHGCYLRGRNIGYHKPSTLKGGRPWKKTYVDPKTKRQRYYELYGGKLAGILTQSLCRELFFEALFLIDKQLNTIGNADLIGQFHDEVVIDWWPGSTSMAQVIWIMEQTMSGSMILPGLPMGVEVKHDYRYTK